MPIRCFILVTVILVAVILFAAAGCSKGIRLRAIPALAGSGKAVVGVVLTYDRNNQLSIVLSGVKDDRYVAWTTPPGGEPVNVGQIRVESGMGRIDTLTPLRKFTLMITREEKGDTQKPSANVVFKSDKEIEW